MLDVFDWASVCYVCMYVCMFVFMSVCMYVYHIILDFHMQIRVCYKAQAFMVIVICQNKYLSKYDYICNIYARYMRH